MHRPDIPPSHATYRTHTRTRNQDSANKDFGIVQRATPMVEVPSPQSYFPNISSQAPFVQCHEMVSVKGQAHYHRQN